MTDKEKAEEFKHEYMGMCASDQEIIEYLENQNKELKQKLSELESQIEKMKCCGNCKKRHSCIKHNNFVYPEMTNSINYGCDNLDKWEGVL